MEARIQAVIDLLLQYPNAGQLTSKGRLRRVAAFPYPYLIFYQAAWNEIIVHGPHHSARHPSTKLE